jgi:hypothetical protein
MNKILDFDKLVSIAPSEIQEWLNRCANTPQTKTWHPEGPNEKVPHNVLIHTGIELKKVAILIMLLQLFFMISEKPKLQG